jgi:hypothetical protein
MESLAARPGVLRDLWLLGDRWPDTRAFASMAAGIFRFFNATTDEQKAIAVYDWVCLSMRRGNAVYEGAPGAKGYNLGPGRMFHVHGHHFCDGLGRLMASIWRATGRPARKTVIQALGHTVAELWYVDADGVARWHVFDPQKGWYVYDRTGSHVASFAEIAADTTLITSPTRASDPYYYHKSQRDRDLGRLAWFTHGWIASVTPECDYYPHLNLLPHQQWEIFYGPEAPNFPGCAAGGCGQDNWDFRSNFHNDGTVSNKRVWPWRGQYLTKATDPKCACAGQMGMPHGTARLTWQVPLDPSVMAACGARVVGQVSYDRAAGTLRPGLSRELAQVIIPIHLPYLVTCVRVEADIGRTGDELNHVILFGSVNGRDWQQLTKGFWGTQGSMVNANAGKVRVEIGPETYGAGSWSPIGSYDLYLRVDLCSVEDVDAVGLAGLKIIIDTETNLFAHCHLQPGENRLQLAGACEQGSAAVDVAIHWTEAGRPEVALLQPAYAGDAWLVEAHVDDPSQIRMDKVVYRYSHVRGVSPASAAAEEGRADARR